MSNGSLMMANGFLAGQAARNAEDSAQHARNAAAWEKTARNNQKAVQEWRAYAKELEQQVRKWQADAVESEAISRAKSEFARCHGVITGDYLRSSEGQELIQRKMHDVRKDWNLE